MDSEEPRLSAPSPAARSGAPKAQPTGSLGALVANLPLVASIGVPILIAVVAGVVNVLGRLSTIEGSLQHLDPQSVAQLRDDLNATAARTIEDVRKRMEDDPGSTRRWCGVTEEREFGEWYVSDVGDVEIAVVVEPDTTAFADACELGLYLRDSAGRAVPSLIVTDFRNGSHDPFYCALVGVTVPQGAHYAVAKRSFRNAGRSDTGDYVAGATLTWSELRHDCPLGEPMTRVQCEGRHLGKLCDSLSSAEPSRTGFSS